eukprot:Rmarinus@m.1042
MRQPSGEWGCFRLNRQSGGMTNIIPRRLRWILRVRPQCDAATTPAASRPSYEAACTRMDLVPGSTIFRRVLRGGRAWERSAGRMSHLKHKRLARVWDSLQGVVGSGTEWLVTSGGPTRRDESQLMM